MSLSEETLSSKTQAPFASCGSSIAAMQPLRDELADLTEEFLRKGGKIITDVKAPVEFKNDIQEDMAQKRRTANTAKNRSTDRAKSGHQNFVLKVLSDGSKSYALIVGNKWYETFSEEDLIPIGIPKRDKIRFDLGMTKALY